MTQHNELERHNRIKEVLVELGLEQNDLAERLGVNINTVSRWCRNTEQPSIKKLRTIAANLGVNAQILIEPTFSSAKSQTKE